LIDRVIHLNAWKGYSPKSACSILDIPTIWNRGDDSTLPLDGTGPTYTGNTRFGHSTIFRNSKRGELQTHTDLNRFVARGSDGSRAFIKEHEHITFNANGVTTVDFDTTRMVRT